MGRKKNVITASRKADRRHRVVTVVGEHPVLTHRRTPCDECPWRKDAKVGTFPAQAYRISAPTDYDMGRSMFGCHMSGIEHTLACAGFLLRGAEHSWVIRMAALSGRYDPSKVASDVELYSSYRAMAIANGVAPDDPVLAPCRGDEGV